MSYINASDVRILTDLNMGLERANIKKRYFTRTFQVPSVEIVKNISLKKPQASKNSTGPVSRLDLSRKNASFRMLDNTNNSHLKATLDSIKKEDRKTLGS